ncbi:MAG: hypothetical protein U1G07_25730 [Verrucomicrobiota bacterium]
MVTGDSFDLEALEARLLLSGEGLTVALPAPVAAEAAVVSEAETESAENTRLDSQRPIDEANDLFAGLTSTTLETPAPPPDSTDEPPAQAPASDRVDGGVAVAARLDANDAGASAIPAEEEGALTEIAASLFTAQGPPEQVSLAGSPGPARPLLLVPGIVGTFPTSDKLDQWLVTRSFLPTDLIIDPLARVYDDLILTIQSNGYTRGTDFFVATYDWRMTPGPSPSQTLKADGTEDFAAYDGVVEQTTADLTDGKFDYGVDYLAYWLQQAATAWQGSHGGAKPASVDVIAHSTGGLVTRVYLQSRAYDENILPKVNNFVTLGVPNRGGARAYPILQDDWNADPSYQLLGLYIDLAYQKYQTGIAITGGDGVIPAGVSRTEFIARYVPTMRALLATYNFYGDDASATIFNRTHPTERNNLALDLNAGLDLQYDIWDLDAATWTYLGEKQPDGSYLNSKPSPTRFVDKLLGKLTVLYGAVGTDEVAQPTRQMSEPWTAVKVIPRTGPYFQYWSSLGSSPTMVAFGSGPNWLAPFGELNGVQAGIGQSWFSEQLRPYGGDGTVPLESGKGFYDPDREEDPGGYLIDFKTGTVGDAETKRLTTDESTQRIKLVKLDANALTGQDFSHTGMVSSLDGQIEVMRAIGRGLLDESRISVGHALTAAQSLWMMLNPYGLAAAYDFSLVSFNGTQVGVTEFAEQPPTRAAGVLNARSTGGGSAAVQAPPPSPRLTAGQADALADGIGQLGSTIEAAFAARADLTAAELGILATTFASHLNLAAAIDATLDRLASDLRALTTPTWRQVLQVFEASGLVSTRPGYFIAPSPLEALIPMRFAYVQAGNAPVELGPNGDDLGITLTTPPSLFPDYALIVDITAGFDFSDGLGDSERFFVRTGVIQQAAIAKQEALTGSVQFDDGTTATIDGGEASLVITLDGAFLDPDETDGKFTAAELAVIAAQRLVTVIPGGELFLRMSATSVSGARYTIMATGASLVGVDPDVVLIKDDTAAMRDRVADLADQLEDIGRALADSQPALNVPLPFLEPGRNTIGQLLSADVSGLDLGGLFDLGTTVRTYLSAPSPSLEGIVVRLQARLKEMFTGAVGNLPGGPFSIGGGFLSASGEFQLRFRYDLDRSIPMGLSDEGLGVEVRGLGLIFRKAGNGAGGVDSRCRPGDATRRSADGPTCRHQHERRLPPGSGTDSHGQRQRGRHQCQRHARFPRGPDLQRFPSPQLDQPDRQHRPADQQRRPDNADAAPRCLPCIVVYARAVAHRDRERRVFPHGQYWHQSNCVDQRTPD